MPKYYLESQSKRFVVDGTSPKNAALHWLTVIIGPIDHLTEAEQCDRIDRKLSCLGETIYCKESGWMPSDKSATKRLTTKALIKIWAETRTIEGES